MNPEGMEILTGLNGDEVVEMRHTWEGVWRHDPHQPLPYVHWWHPVRPQWLLQQRHDASRSAAQLGDSSGLPAAALCLHPQLALRHTQEGGREGGREISLADEDQ